MQRQGKKPLYRENHEAFRRLLIVGSISVVIGVFFTDKVASSELLGWMRGWVSTVMWGSGLMVLALCFLLNPKQYSIYPDSLLVEWVVLPSKGHTFRRNDRTQGLDQWGR